jgi:glucose-1-phosphate thymidylyltransferase
MKGIILAGGTGSRLSPVTKVINKHLLPVGNYPMIFWSIFKLKEAGITDLLIVTNYLDIPDFYRLLGTGEVMGVNINYQIQTGAKGIADAVYLGKDFVKDEPFIVILGDNLFKDSLIEYIEKFQEQRCGAKVLLKNVSDPERYGIATIDKEKKLIKSIIEKPKNPVTNYCVVGVYMFDSKVFQYINKVVPSDRGELEITDVNNQYIMDNCLTYDFLNEWWIDAGTYDAFYKANQLIREYNRR